MRNLVVPVLALVFCLLPQPLFSQPPVLFYSDLDSGPKVGGEGGVNGAFVCVYGENFGSAPGLLEVGGIEVSAYKLWADPGRPYVPAHYAKACGQIAAQTPSGAQSIQLTTAAGASNALPFTVRPGIIYWVTTAGNDAAGDGSQANPWVTIPYCKNQMAPGDICVIGNGVTLTRAENYNVALLLDSSGAVGAPKAIVAYPGQTVTIDVSHLAGGRGVQSYLSGTDVSYWTLAGLAINANEFAVSLQRGTSLRFVDNDVQCTGRNCNGASAGYSSGATYLYTYGSRFHDIGCHETLPKYAHSPHPCAWINANTTISSIGTTLHLVPYSGWTSRDVIRVNGQMRRTTSCRKSADGSYTCHLDLRFSSNLVNVSSWQFRPFQPSKLFHTVYLSSYSYHSWFGWNEVDGSAGKACRGVLVNADSAKPLYDLHIHDNWIHDTVCDGLDFASVNPSQGTVEAYNNVIYNAGMGPDPPDAPANYTCIYSPGGINNGPAGSGAIEIYSNTLYQCGRNPGSALPSQRGAIGVSRGLAPLLAVNLENNLIVQTSGLPYLTKISNGTITGSNNDCYGSGACPAQFGPGAISVNPNFVNPGTHDFHLLPGSPVIGASSATPAPATDLDGWLRSAPYSLGAYEFP